MPQEEEKIEDFDTKLEEKLNIAAWKLLFESREIFKAIYQPNLVAETIKNLSICDRSSLLVRPGYHLFSNSHSKENH